MKGKIVFYDNEPEFTSQFLRLMEEAGFDICLFNDIETLRSKLQDGNFMSDVKALIFDLAKDTQEATQMKDFAIVKDIKEKFHTLRIPIFIHSAFASRLEDFNGFGTVWKVDKSGTSLEDIVKTINNLDASGFLQAFTPGGLIEQSLFRDLHKSFTEQFREGEIEKVIGSFTQDPAETLKIRVINVFRRVAVRSLLSALMIDSSIEDGTYNEDKISAIEHYIRRINRANVPIWTGDIFAARDGSNKVIILTPRCDVASKGKDELLACIVSPAETPTKKNVADYIKDNIKEKKYRYLPFTPLFSGGKVDFSAQKIIPKNELEKYEYVISLSEDLTNEILGKYCSYLLRTSIPEVDQKEIEAFLK
ncbi:MAG: hypothetical protein JST90_15720 [Bacteroidetes bacterium]|nr:hypothetical protein [Bacteroidota bacterium]